MSGIANLRTCRKTARRDFPIIITPVIHRLNFRDLPQMVVWAKKIRATAIHFQPVDRWTPETFNELWIDDPQDRADLRAVRDDQIAQKRKGAAILKSKLLLRAWDEHFLSQPAPDEYRPCRVGMRNYFIRPDRAVEVCWHYKPSEMCAHRLRRKSGMAQKQENAAKKPSRAMRCACSPASHKKPYGQGEWGWF